MPSKTVQESLVRTTRQHRLVFWYDADRGWAEDFEHFSATGVEKLAVDGNEFGTKVHITRNSPPDQHFLVYLPYARPLQDSDNWLLDLLLQGHEFKADKTSLALQEVGLPYEYKDLAEKHLHFFSKAKNIQALKAGLAIEDRQPEIRLKMMAILIGAPAGIEALVLHFLRDGPPDNDADPVASKLGPANLAEPFWKEVSRLYGYTAARPSLLDFGVFLFSAANPLDGKVPLRADAKVLLQRWKDSREYGSSFRDWSDDMERRLHIEGALEARGDNVDLGDCDTFEVIDRYIIGKLCTAFARGAAPAELRAVIQQRKHGVWAEQHADGYAALEQALELRELMAGADLTVGSIDEGLKRYTGNWWRIDRAYRRCMYFLRRYGQIKVMERVAAWAEKHYVTNFQLPLSDNWSDQVVRQSTWRSEFLNPQRQFFDHYVQPLLDKRQTVFVVVSDALRFEAAADFASQLNSENRWSADVEAMLGTLPSYTQAGMAALLPGKRVAVDPDSGAASVDGKSATGLGNRGSILSEYCGGRAVALGAEEFRGLNSKTEGRDLMSAHDVIYIFHDKIDFVGDKVATEATTTAAVEEAFEDLHKILKKIASINGANMLLTADHGFLFQQDDVDDHDLHPFPADVEWSYQNRRFGLSKVASMSQGVKTFSAAQLGLDGDWFATFPLALRRFPIRGSGKRFVHGGFNLQEVVIPVVRARKARTDDTALVAVDFMRTPTRVTTGQCSLAVFQEQPVGGKVQGRTLRVAIYADDTLLSDTKTITFDSTDPEPRSREFGLVLTMSALADRYNNRDVEIRLDEETSPGNGRYATYRRHSVRLHKPFAKDFDD